MPKPKIMKSKVSNVKKKRPQWILRVASCGMKIKENRPAAVVEESKSIMKIAMILLFVYLCFGVVIYWLLVDQFSGTKTNRWVDALYFFFVTFCTVGYGDIVPSTVAAKILTSVLVLIGAGFLDFLLNGVVSHILDLQENAILARIRTRRSAIKGHVVDAGNGRIRTRWKIPLALCGVFLCIVAGALFLHFHEHLGLVDSVYLSIVSVATVGYGDKSFKSVEGRIFAVFWLLFSTLAMASFFIYLAEMRIARSTTAMKLPKRKSDSDSDGFELIEAGKVSGESVFDPSKLIEAGDESVFDPFKLLEAGKVRYKAVRRRVLLRVPNCRLLQLLAAG